MSAGRSGGKCWGPMSPDLLVVLAFILRMGVAAAFVVVASMIAERSGPLIGAMVSTLPISAGPSYVFLALEHPPAFIADSVLTSLVINAVTAVFAVAYAAAAQRHGPAVSVAIALGLWLAAAVLVARVPWSLTGALGVNIVVFAVCVPLGQRFVHVKMPLVRRRWYDVPLRAAMVGCLVTTVVGLSTQVGPALTGVLTVFPIVLTSLMLILQPRIGGPAAAAVIAHTTWGLVGFAAALVTLGLAVVPLGAAVALSAALAVSIGWNVMIWLWRRRETRAQEVG